ncbi:MAG: sigma-70 family RNA polymerase sigma factor [Saprospiraceae bacterium]|nr:sigma-70 family RNA polymerase sigma factor [Lewinella sp.]
MNYLQSHILRLMLNEKKHTRNIQYTPSTIESFYLRHRESLFKWLIKYFGLQLEEAKELAQQAFAIFIQKAVTDELPDFEKESNAKSYLFAIAKNKARERARQLNFIIKLPDSYDEFTVEEQTSTNEERERKINQAEIAFNKLGEKCRQLLTHAIVLKTPMQDIARLLDYKNASTAKNLKLKCLHQLRKLFAEP